MRRGAVGVTKQKRNRSVERYLDRMAIVSQGCSVLYFIVRVSAQQRAAMLRFEKGGKRVDKLLIRGAVVIDPASQYQETQDVLVADGMIAARGKQLSCPDAAVMDAEGLVCIPGLVDIHVHLRDPGQTHKEDILSGCRAAAAGGITSVACMPNTSPACDLPETVHYIKQTARQASAHVYPIAAATRSLAGEELTDLRSLHSAGAVAVSDDGRPVATAALMKTVMETAAALGVPVLAHCEELSLVQGGIMNEGTVSRSLGVPGISRAAEDVGTAREIALAAATGCPVHICHVSTRGSVELIRDARRRGVPVTGETAPHYFYLTDECLRKRDADYRMNPPLRTEEDRQAIIEGLRDGTLEIIATDHAPHAAAEKADFDRAPNGAVGLETSLAVGITALVHPGYLTLMQLVEKMSLNPARLLHLPAGTLEVGAQADLVLLDPQASWVVEPDKLHGKSGNTPFKGETLYGRIKATLLGGKIVYRG